MDNNDSLNHLNNQIDNTIQNASAPNPSPKGPRPLPFPPKRSIPLVGPPPINVKTKPSPKSKTSKDESMKLTIKSFASVVRNGRPNQLSTAHSKPAISQNPPIQDPKSAQALVDLTKQYGASLLSEKILAMHHAAFGSGESKTSKGGLKPLTSRMTTKGPSRRQVLIPFDDIFIRDKCSDKQRITEFVNRELTNTDSKLRIEATTEISYALSLHTNFVASEKELTTIRNGLIAAIDIKNIAQPRLPMSKSYLKIVGVDYFWSPHGAGTSTQAITPDQVEHWIKRSSLFEGITLASRPRVMRASPNSDMAIIWVDIWDTQKGSFGRPLVNRSFNFGYCLATICTTNQHPGVPQCQKYWRWGHNSGNCRARSWKCAICSGPHSTGNHRTLAWCCKAAPKANPPRVATESALPCPHIFKCFNCKDYHPANDKSCIFWRKRFDRNWHNNKANESRTGPAVKNYFETRAPQHNDNPTACIDDPVENTNDEDNEKKRPQELTDDYSQEQLQMRGQRDQFFNGYEAGDDLTYV